MDGFADLGIAPTTDLRAIKRAYAGRLKIARPEDDPAAFQRLNQAYQAALHWAQAAQPDAGLRRGEAPSARSAADEALPEDDRPSAGARGTQHAPGSQASLIIDDHQTQLVPVVGAAAYVTTLAELVGLSTTPTVPDPLLLEWLEAHLLPLRSRASLGAGLLAELDRQEALPSSDRIALLSDFFGWRALATYGPERRVLARAAAVAELTRSLQVVHVFDPERARTRSDDGLLVRPAGWLRPWLYAWWSPLPARLNRRIDQLDLLSEGQVERVLPVSSVRFWRRLSPMRPLTRQGVWLILGSALSWALLICTPGILGWQSAASTWRVNWWATGLACFSVLAALGVGGDRNLQRSGG